MMMYRDKTFIAAKTGFDVIEGRLVEVECPVPRVFTTWHYFQGNSILRIGAMGSVAFQEVVYDLFGNSLDILEIVEGEWVDKMPKIEPIPGTSHVGYIVIEQRDDVWIITVMRDDKDTGAYSFKAQKWHPASVIHDCVIPTQDGGCTTFALPDMFKHIELGASAQLVYLKVQGLSTKPELLVWKPDGVDEFGVHHDDFENYDIHKLLAYDQFMDARYRPRLALFC